MNENELTEWLYNHGHHNSLYLKFKEMNECETPVHNPNELSPEYLTDRMYQVFLNTDGVFMIGDTISYVTPHTEFVITDGDLSKVNILRNHRETELENVIRVELRSDLKYVTTLTQEAHYDDDFQFEFELELQALFWRRSATLNAFVEDSDGDKKTLYYWKVDWSAYIKIESVSSSYLHYDDSHTDYNIKNYSAEIVDRGGTGKICSMNFSAVVKFKEDIDDDEMSQFGFHISPTFCSH